MMGLTLAIMEYEWDLKSGYKGLAHIPEKPGVNNTHGYFIEEAISDRVNDDWTNTLRWLNCLTCVMTLSCLILRRFLKTRWIN